MIETTTYSKSESIIVAMMVYVGKEIPYECRLLHCSMSNVRKKYPLLAELDPFNTNPNVPNGDYWFSFNLAIGLVRLTRARILTVDEVRKTIKISDEPEAREILDKYIMPMCSEEEHAVLKEAAVEWEEQLFSNGILNHYSSVTKNMLEHR